MPIRGDRLRWPPRPGKRPSDFASNTGSRRSLPSTDDSTSRQPDPPNKASEHRAIEERETVEDNTQSSA